jgi:hypothetical protein
MSGPRRISLRLDPERLELLQKHCYEAGYDLSRVVRQALDSYFGAELGRSPDGAPPRRLAPPEQIIPLTSKYLGWGDGDLRKEFKRLYRETLAAAIASKRLYPRTEWVIRTYEALLALYPVVEPEE